MWRRGSVTRRCWQQPFETSPVSLGDRIQARPELGPGIFTWHLRLSRSHLPVGVGSVHRPRHFVLYRQVGDVVEIVRVLQ